jgi:hypothetical protein
VSVAQHSRTSVCLFHATCSTCGGLSSTGLILRATCFGELSLLEGSRCCCWCRLPAVGTSVAAGTTLRQTVTPR